VNPTRCTHKIEKEA